MEDKKTQFRWVIVSMLWLITVINYIDRAAISYTVDVITSTFHLGLDKIGLILGAFGIGYTLFTFLGGLAADKMSPKKILGISFLFWGISCFLIGFANGFYLLFAARILLGLSEGPAFPTMTKVLSEWLPEEERNQSLSLMLVAVPLALAIGGPLSALLIIYFSWRGLFYFLGILALLWIPMLHYFQDNPAKSIYVNKAELNHIQQTSLIVSKLKQPTFPWRVLLFDKTLLVNNWSFFVFGYYLFFFMTWLPHYLQLRYHLDLEKVGFYTVYPWLFSALMMWLVGSLTDHIFKKTKSLRLSRSYPIIITQLLAGLFIIPILFVNHLFFALLFISLAIGSTMSANACYYSVNIDIAKERTGTALGIMDALFAISGFIAPSLTGFLISATGHFEAAFILLAFLALSSTVLTFLFHNVETSHWIST